MKTNYEIALGEFMPAFRAKAARLMVSKYGISQQRSAELLELTQAAISKYVSGKYSQRVRSAAVSIDDSLVDSFVRRVVGSAEKEAQKTVCSACQKYHKYECSIMIK